MKDDYLETVYQVVIYGVLISVFVGIMSFFDFIMTSELAKSGLQQCYDRDAGKVLWQKECKK